MGADIYPVLLGTDGKDVGTILLMNEQWIFGTSQDGVLSSFSGVGGYYVSPGGNKKESYATSDIRHYSTQERIFSPGDTVKFAIHIQPDVGGAISNIKAPGFVLATGH